LGAVTLFLALAYFNRHRDAVHQKDANNSTLPREQRMTTNPEDTPVTSGLISPDGKYLAYTDKTGFYLRMVDGGETHSVPLEKGFDTAPESWFPDSVHLVVSRVDDPQRQPSLWQVSVFGGPPRKLTDAGYQASVSPDGSQILFLRHSGPSEEVWLMRADGLEASKIVASNKYTFSQLAWAPDGRRFAYARTTTRYYTMRSGPDTQVEIMDLRSHQITVVGMEGQRGLPRGGAAVGWLPDGRLIFPVREPRPNQQDTNLWWIRIDPQTSQPIGSRTRITIDHGIAVQLSISADGKRMALRRHAPQSDIFVSEIRNGGAGLSKPQRLTLDDRNDNAMAWTADSNTVIFYSNRDGPWHVFKQRIDSSQAELLVGGPDDLYLPRMTPDGKNVLYVVRAKPGATSDDAQLMRVPVEGGVSQFVLKAPGLWDVECARLPSRLCMYSQILAGHQTFYRFNPDAGEAAEYRAAEMAGDNFNWILAPDGQHLAWSTQQDPSSMFGIRILNLDTGKTQQIPIAQWADIFGVDWAADSKSLWLAARNSGGWSAVLHVQMNGKISNVLNFRNNDFDWVIPSPDGRRLAIVQEMNNSNVWLLENF
jgi:Tol biopolymer transport system component